MRRPQLLHTLSAHLATAIPKLGIYQNKSRKSGVFFAVKKPPPIHHAPPRRHHRFTIKTPPQKHTFSQNPLQKRRNPPEKNSAALPSHRRPGCASHLRFLAQSAHPLMVHKIRQPAVVTFHCILKAPRTIFVRARVCLNSASSVLLLHHRKMQLLLELITRRAKHCPPALSPTSAERLSGYLYSAANESASLFISAASAACENKITR